MSKPILITGATGKQGGAVLRALLNHPAYNPTTFPIYALTRNTDSTSAKNLTTKSPTLKLIPGDLNNTPAIFASLPSAPWGVFSVQLPGKREVAQGKALIDAALAAGTQHFVYTSVDRGGDASIDSPTPVPHFKSKHEIEHHLIRAATQSKASMSYTILRPAFFLDNLEWSFIGKVISTAWRDHVPASKPLQVIATIDIGSWGAAAFLESDTPVYHNKGISLAGDNLTFREANEIFERETGMPIPVTYGWLASLMLFLVADVRLMFQWFAEKGFAADVGRLRAMDMGLRDFRMWVKGTKFAKKTA